MAYLKYKEVTKYFNFKKQLSDEALPSYVTDYLNADEEIYGAYRTARDMGLITDKRFLLFDQKLGRTKEITSIPYATISTCSIIYRSTTVDMFIYLESGYPFRLRFVNQKADDKTKLRKIYTRITNQVSNRNK